MKVYWDTEDHSYIIENENGKRMRVSSEMVEDNPTSDYVVMMDAVLIHKVDPLDMISVGDKVNPAEVEREGVVLRLIGTSCYIIYCATRWRMSSGDGLDFCVDEAVLDSKGDDVFLKVVRDRLLG